eukprot:GHRQ01016589.1.p1 GENE.GHRQ01016589.1~~GHRQ01016589.1.p1  ORF type:complete len:120 (-),score=9.38 GHRQ01016589.1:164-523(-)
MPAAKMVTDDAAGASTNAPIVGFLGLGIMGTAMCRNLLKCGAFSKVVVWNRTASKVGSATIRVPRYNAHTAEKRPAHEGGADVGSRLNFAPALPSGALCILDEHAGRACPALLLPAADG